MDNKQLAEKYELEKDHFWKHKQSGKWIVSHKAVMKIAEIEGVEFGKPEIHREGMTSIALWGTATLGDRTIWSFGEAMPENCRMPYFWAMAEKRLKDRLTLTLIDVYGDIYSEIEADEFAFQHPEAGLKSQSDHGPPTEKQRKYCVRLIEEKILDKDKKKWFKKFDAAQDTWAMSMIIDRLKPMPDAKDDPAPVVPDPASPELAKKPRLKKLMRKPLTDDESKVELQQTFETAMGLGD